MRYIEEINQRDREIDLQLMKHIHGNIRVTSILYIKTHQNLQKKKTNMSLNILVLKTN